MTFQQLQEEVSKEQREANITAKYEEDMLTISRCIDKLLEVKKTRTEEYLKALTGVRNGE